MDKTKVLHLRVSPKDYDRIERAAHEAHLAIGTWVRQTVLNVLEPAPVDTPQQSGAAARKRSAKLSGKSRKDSKTD